MARDKLTPKQKRFVDEYLIDLNATQAAIRAGYSQKHADRQGYQLLEHTRVAAAIAKAQARLSERTEITQDKVLKELALIGFADMATYLELGPDGTPTMDWSKLPEGATRVISEITQETVRTVSNGEREPPSQVVKTKFKLYDKRAALVDIGRHLGMFTDKVKVEGSLTLDSLWAAIDGKTLGVPSERPPTNH